MSTTWQTNLQINRNKLAFSYFREDGQSFNSVFCVEAFIRHLSFFHEIRISKVPFKQNNLEAFVMWLFFHCLSNAVAFVFYRASLWGRPQD